MLHVFNVGGAELLAKQLALACQDHFRPVFLCLDAMGSLGAELIDKGFIVEVVYRQPGFDYKCAGRIARFLDTHDVKLVHAHQYAPFFYTSIARMFKWNCPILFTEHGRDYPDYRRPKRVLANRLLLRRHDRVIAVGEHVREALVDNEGIPISRVEVIHNGVDVQRFNPARPNRLSVRASLGLREKEIGVIQVARLNRLKDYETAIRTMQIVCRSAPNVRYFIVGEGEERTKIEAMIRDVNMENQIRMLGLREDVAELLEGMDIFLLTSVSEGIPLTLIEAMSAQLPCVATRVGGIPEVVHDGTTGVLSDSGDCNKLSEALLKLIQSPSVRQRMGECGRKRAMELFQSDRMLGQYKVLYAQLTNPPVRTHKQ
jgi:glycosyltransferase involved in cell wall biosynthesis